MTLSTSLRGVGTSKRKQQQQQQQDPVQAAESAVAQARAGAATVGVGGVSAAPLHHHDAVPRSDSSPPTTDAAAAAATTTTTLRRSTGSSPVLAYFFVIMILFSILSFIIDHRHTLGMLHQQEVLAGRLSTTTRASLELGFSPPLDTVRQALDAAVPSTTATATKTKTKSSKSKDVLPGLTCDKYGGPDDKAASEMVYWKDIPADNQHRSPFQKQGVAEYLTFEPDHGGWNNIRMAMETVLGLAFAMGRTLVLPPEDEMYLLKNDKDTRKGKEQRNKFSFNHFFHMEAIHEEHAGLDIITMKEFLTREALAGNFRDEHGNAVFPPNNKTEYDGAPPNEIFGLYQWLRKHSHTAAWDPEECQAAFPASTHASDVRALERIQEELEKSPPQWEDYIGKPVAVNASTMDRMKEQRAGRKRLCMYDSEMQKARFVHFPTDHSLDLRLLVHFYAFLFFQDWKQQLWVHRFIRDHVRYTNEIQCAAARVVAALRQRVQQETGDAAGTFDSIHVRRGDFQYKLTRIPAENIYAQTKKILPEGTVLFIATDERDKSYFKPLADHYKILFLDDFMDQLDGVNTNFFGMIDQLVASRGRYFFGCWFSTFTGYINRLRGYHADKDKLPGYEQGIIPSWYYVPLDRFDHMQEYYPVKKSFYAREFPMSWRLIDFGIDEFHKELAAKQQ